MLLILAAESSELVMTKQDQSGFGSSWAGGSSGLQVDEEPRHEVFCRDRTDRTVRRATLGRRRPCYLLSFKASWHVDRFRSLTRAGDEAGAEGSARKLSDDFSVCRKHHGENMLHAVRLFVCRKSARCGCFLVLWDELPPRRTGRRRNVGVVESTILIVP